MIIATGYHSARLTAVLRLAKQQGTALGLAL